MRYAVAIWNYMEPGTDFLALIDEFVGLGYDAIAAQARQFTDLDTDQADALVSYLHERDLQVAVHGNFDTDLADLRMVHSLLGDRLRTVTFDAAMRPDSRGQLFDTARMAGFLGQIIEMTPSACLKVAVEDFPLDATGLEFYREDLQPLLECPRYGILIDVGHLNLRLAAGGYFEGVTVDEYFRRLPLPVVEVHLHDNRGKKDDHAHFGYGDVDFAQVRRALKAIGFDGLSTIEIAPTFHGSTPQQSKPRARESLQTWRALWEGTTDT